MPRFFFDISDTGDVYHDTRGALLLGQRTGTRDGPQTSGRAAPNSVPRSGLHGPRL
ncbi:hypothetical protein MPLDJ20_260057 [Mesorhizobium plurifarium]|uniref:Uncharacterized protein n=1 Tax=Mesorhizobium plurifarium TaxID=69974 RepID=A0A090FDD5_MESPL|nr:hypothetical protein MPLDJ20_260057 [Mesorhizobium plurifarium]